MAAPRLSDSQKIEIVARYRAGEGSTELAEAYGCSANTVSRPNVSPWRRRRFP